MVPVCQHWCSNVASHIYVGLDLVWLLDSPHLSRNLECSTVVIQNSLLIKIFKSARLVLK